MTPGDHTPLPVPKDADVARLEYAVFGHQGNNGLIGKVHEMKLQVTALRIGQAKLGVLIGAAAGIVSGIVVALAGKLLGG